MSESPTYLMTYWFSTSVGELGFGTSDYLDLESAEIAGVNVGCLGGATLVEVRSPDGTLQARWDKTDTGLTADGETHMSSLWQRIGDESKALGEALRDEFM